MGRSMSENAKAVSEAREVASRQIELLQSSLRELQRKLKSDPLASVMISKDVADAARLLYDATLVSARDNFTYQEIADQVGTSKQSVFNHVEHFLSIGAVGSLSANLPGVEL